MDTPLRITGIGLASSLGCRVETAAAAFRAGMSRAQSAPSFTIETPDGEEQAINIHQARPVVEGLEGFARWLHLAQQAWTDLCRFTALTSEQLTRTRPPLGLIVILPAITIDRFGWEDEQSPAILDQEVLVPFLQHCRLTVPPEHRVVLCHDRTGLAEALRLAEEGFAGNRWGRVVILAVDSHLDAASLESLLATDRLKTPTHPVGVVAGEAAACLLLESPADTQIGVDTGVRIAAYGRSAEAPVDGTPSPSPMGDQLARRMLQTWESLPATGRPTLSMYDHYLDLTGETWRAQAWGHLLALTAHTHSGTTLSTWLPASGFGEVGAAGPGLSLCLAVRAFQRSYARHSHAVIWSLQSTGEVSVIQLDAAGTTTPVS